MNSFRRIYIVVIFIFLILSTIGGVLLTQKQQETNKEIYLQHTKSSLEQLANNIALSVKLYDVITINQIISQSTLFKTTKGELRIKKQDNRMLFSPKSNFGDCDKIISNRIVYDGEVLGEIEACVNLPPALTATSSKIFLFMLTFGIMLGLLIIGLIQWQTRDFSTLLHALRSIEFNDLKHSIQSLPAVSDRSLSKIIDELKVVLEKIETHQSFIREAKINKVKAELAAKVAHDIRSPLFALKLLAKSENNLSNEQRDLLKSTVIHIKDIAEQMLIDTKQTPNLPFNNPPIPQILYEIKRQKELEYKDAKNFNLIVTVDNNLNGLSTTCSHVALQSVISNLINNSVESLLTDKFGNIQIHGTRIEDKVVISISDNGRGIPDKFKDKIFNSGFSHGKENHQKSGNGLGMYFAKKTIEENNGQITLKSELNQGTTITLVLPLNNKLTM